MDDEIRLRVVFYKTETGKEPVREWLKSLSREDRIARTVFTVEDGVMVLLHGFIKKAQKLPKHDLALARKRAAKLRGYL